MQSFNPQFPMPPAAPVESRKYGKIAALFLSFGSGELYRDVARRWKGIGFWYLVLLMLITSIPESIKFHLGFKNFAQHEAAATIKDFPTISIDNNGEASIKEPEPYLWREEKTGQVLLYVDTSGAFDLPEGKDAFAKLSKTKLELRRSEFQTQTYELSQIKGFQIDRNKLSGWVDTASHWFGAVWFGITFFFGVFWHLIQILIYGLIGMVICSMAGAKLGYPALLRVCAVAITPAIVLDEILTLAGVNFPMENLMFFVLEMAFVIVAILANKMDQMPQSVGFQAGIYPPPPPQQ